MFDVLKLILGVICFVGIIYVKITELMDVEWFYFIVPSLLVSSSSKKTPIISINKSDTNTINTGDGSQINQADLITETSNKSGGNQND